MQKIFQWINAREARSSSTTAYCLTILLLVLLTACSGQPPENPAPPPPQVEVITIAPQTVDDQPEFIGQTEAFRPVEIRPQVSGIIKKFISPKGVTSNKATSYT